MARPSKLTDAQWEKIGKRLLADESAASLAREYGVSKATISIRFSQRVQKVKEVANQLVTTDRAMSLLNVSEQMAARSLADDLKAIGDYTAQAARSGAETSSILNAMAVKKARLLNHNAPMDEEALTSLKGIAALTRTANEAAQIGTDLMKASKDLVDEANNRTLDASRPSMSTETVTFRIVSPDGN